MPDESTGAAPTRDGATAHQRATEALRDVPRTPGVAKPDPILIADKVVRRFGGLTAVNVGHVEIQRGAITALI
ncbi:MAG: ABC transporter ATP-binding protein, partial [Actinoplanes sp.]